MTILLNIIAVLFLTSCGSSGSGGLQAVGSGVIYGDEDNRSDTSIDKILRNNNLLYDEAKMLLKLSKSTAGMVKIGKHVNLLADGSAVAKKPLKPLSIVKKGLCENERFAKQYTLPICTGFLVAPDLLVTAGHCINKSNFKKRAWIFGYDQSRAKEALPTFAPEYVYRVRRVLRWGGETAMKIDYALVWLKRKVTIAKPLKFRRDGEASVGTRLAIIGHPSGLPTKISANAEILETERNAYKTNLDSFGGNSGSPVFNLETGEVEGILISGATDYVPNFDKKCIEVGRKMNSEGSEMVAKISIVKLEKYLPVENSALASNF